MHARICALQRAWHPPAFSTNDIPLSNGHGLLRTASVGESSGSLYAGPTYANLDCSIPPSGMRTTIYCIHATLCRQPSASYNNIVDWIRPAITQVEGLRCFFHVYPLPMLSDRGLHCTALHCTCITWTLREEVCLKPARLV